MTPASGGYPHSYYADSVDLPPRRAALEGSQEADICIVGAGFSGLAAGLFLRERGYRVILLEGERVGWGASGRNGGQLINGFNGGIDFLHDYFSDCGTSVAELHLAGGDILREVTERHRIDCDYRPGHVTVAYTQKHMQGLAEEAKLCQRHDIPGYQLLDKDQLQEYVGSGVYAGGLLDGRGGHIR